MLPNGARRAAATTAKEPEEGPLALAKALAGFGTFELELANGLFQWCPSLEALHGLRPGSFQGTREAWEALIDPRDHAAVRRAIADSIPATSPVEAEWRITGPHGSVRRIKGRWQAIRDASGRPLRLIGVQYDVTEQRRLAERLEHSETRLQRLFDAMPNGAVVWEPLLEDGHVTDLRLQLASANFGRLTGLPPSTGALLSEMLPGAANANPELLSAAQFTLDTGTSMRFEVTLGALGNQSFAITTFRPEPGIVAAAFENITEHRRAHEALQRNQALLRAQNERLARGETERRALLDTAQRELNALAHTLTHSLRAPLRGMGGYLSILAAQLQDAAPAEAKQSLDRARQSTRDMGALLDDLSDYFHSSHRPLRLEKVDMTALAQDAAKRLTAQSPDRQIEVSLEALPDTQGDRELLQQVWTDLIDNAIKFTRGRQIAHIRIGASPDPETGGVRYRVEDDGVGFDPAYQDKLFILFQRLHPAETFPGTGVGLATVHRILERHGGQVQAEGRPDAGATFSFTLPHAGPILPEAPR